MNAYQSIMKRRSMRSFENKEIPKDVVTKLKESLLAAPSAGNLQSRKFFFVYNEEVKKKVSDCSYNQDFISEAPLVVVGCADMETSSMKYGERGKGLYSVVDTSLSIENLMLVAVENGLGTCWVGGFDEEKVSKILDLDVGLKPIAILPVGYSKYEAREKDRMSVDEAIQDIT